MSYSNFCGNSKENGIYYSKVAEDKYAKRIVVKRTLESVSAYWMAIKGVINKMLTMLGILLIFLGMKIYLYPKFYSFKFQAIVDYSGINIGLSLAMMLLGGYMIWTEHGKKK
jgi:uncharacterized membrane protein